MSPRPVFTYNAEVLSVHDGDTVTLRIDVGLRIFCVTPIRLFGINAPELATPDGPPSRDHLAGLLASGQVTITTFKNPTDKYGRWLADVFSSDGVDVCQKMVTDGFAVVWDGHGPKPV